MIMKRQPILSICIATYNRARFIGQTLDSIVPQLTNDTELLIVDGASTDDTETILRQYASREPRLRYVRLPQKGGVDQDYCKAVELAEGKYCWLFTDDDILKPGAIQAVLEKIDIDFSLLIVNAQVWNSDFTTKLKERLVKSDRDIEYDTSQFEQFGSDTIHYLSFIGGVVIRRDLWMVRERVAYYGSEFVHQGVIFQSPLPGKACLISNPYISIRYGNAQWRSRNFEIWMFKWPRLIWSFNAISEQTKRAITLKEPWRNLYVLAIRRAMGAYSLFEYRKYLRAERGSIIWKLGALFIALLPFGLINKYMTFRFRSVKDGELPMHDFLSAARAGKPSK